MTFEALKKQIQQKTFQPIYVLAGEESYFIDEIEECLEANILDESEKAFNQNILYGKDVKAEDIISNARRYPMMSEYNVLFIREAQYLRDFKAMDIYFKKPQMTTILVMLYKGKKIDKRTAAYKSLKKNGIYFESNKIKEYKIPEWIVGFLRREKVTIEPKALPILTEYLGNDLAIVVNQLRKLLINRTSDHISVDEVYDNIGIHREYNLFELGKWIGFRNEEKCYRIIQHLSQNPAAAPAPLLIGSLYYYFNKLFMVHVYQNADSKRIASAAGIPPFAISEYKKVLPKYNFGSTVKALNILLNFDKKFKGIDRGFESESELQRELIYRLLHC